MDDKEKLIELITNITDEKMIAYLYAFIQEYIAN